MRIGRIPQFMMIGVVVMSLIIGSGVMYTHHSADTTSSIGKESVVSMPVPTLTCPLILCPPTPGMEWLYEQVDPWDEEEAVA